MFAERERKRPKNATFRPCRPGPYRQTLSLPSSTRILGHTGGPARNRPWPRLPSGVVAGLQGVCSKHGQPGSHRCGPH